MARFEDAIGTILEHEGGIVNHKDDPGGLTNRGITLETFKKVRGANGTPAELLSLSKDGATEIYRAYYWLRVYELIDHQDTATKILDMAVNMGHRQAHVLVQRACGDCGFRVAADGLFGPSTVAAVNCCNPHALMLAIVHHQIDFYRELAATRPTMQAFLSGWLQRAAWMSNEQQGAA